MMLLLLRRLLLLFFLCWCTHAQECTEGDAECAAADSCVDLHEKCLDWASVGKCSGEEENYSYYHETCPKSCRTCWSCDDENESCKMWADAGECIENPQYMLVYCAKSCNICHYKGDLRELMLERMKIAEEAKEQEAALYKTKFGVEQTITTDEARETNKAMEEYMETKVMLDDKYSTVRKDCLNRSPNCVFWASIGECEKTRDYMVVQCAPACQTCEMLLLENRCPHDPNAPTALNSGDLDIIFEKMLTIKQYSPQVLSRPNSTDPNEHDGPWVITFDTFLTPEESKALIQLGYDQGYAESADVGKKKFDGTFDKKVNTGRTSTNAWCQNDCETDPVTVTVTKRISTVLGIPDENFEYFQLLKYEVGQFYQQHHDYIDFHTERKQGVRTLTVFLYLNEPKAGGGTNFPKLGNLTVMPRQGKALIWPSVLNEDPNKKDPRTDHQALPVEEGVKYGANAWVHQRDFKEPFSRACI